MSDVEELKRLVAENEVEQERVVGLWLDVRSRVPEDTRRVVDGLIAGRQRSISIQRRMFQLHEEQRAACDARTHVGPVVWAQVDVADKHWGWRCSGCGAVLAWTDIGASAPGQELHVKWGRWHDGSFGAPIFDAGLARLFHLSVVSPSGTQAIFGIPGFQAHEVDER